MIVTLGSTNLDRIIYVDHLPQVGETSMAKYEVSQPGGKGANQAIAARRIGSEVYFFSAVGQDTAGSILLDNLQSYGLDAHGISVVPAKLSGAAYITVDKNGDNTISYIPGANLDVKASQVPTAMLTSETVILLQMEINPVENWKLVHNAKANGSRIILNAAPIRHIPLNIINSIDVLVMNSTEASMFANELEIAFTSFESLSVTLANRFGNTCIITLGSDGVVAASNGLIYCVPALDVKVIDTTSAGDAFIGAFASYFERGYSLKDCITAGNIAGGLAVSKCGAQDSIPTGEEVTAVFRQIKEQRNIA